MDLRRTGAWLARWGALAPVGLIALFLAGAAQSFGAASPDAVFSTRGRVGMLAADGNHAAVTTIAKGGCGRIVVWTAPGNQTTRLKPGTLGCSGGGVSRIADGGGRGAWLAPGGGNNLELTVMADKLLGEGETQID